MHAQRTLLERITSVFFRELPDHEIPPAEKRKLHGLHRVKTWHPGRYKNARKPALIILGFSLFILLLTRNWHWVPVPFVISGLIFIAVYMNPITVCPECRREMDYCKPQRLPGIRYDWCRKCKCYCNVRWVPEGEA